MSVIPFKKPAKEKLASAFEESADCDALGCVRFSCEEMEALQSIQCDDIAGETVFKDVILNASRHEASYIFRLTAFEPPYLAVKKIRNANEFAYTLSAGQQESMFFNDFADMVSLARDMRDAAIPQARQLQIKATLAAQQTISLPHS